MEETAHAIPWTDIVAAIAALANVLLTLGLLVVAWCAWLAARGTLRASEDAATAAQESAEQARLSVLAMERDSKERTRQHEQATRPYVHARLAPSLLGPRTRAWDLILENFGQSAAYSITLQFDEAAADSDVITEANLRLSESGFMLAPAQRLRTVWYLPEDDDAVPPTAMGSACTALSIKYQTDAGKTYHEGPITLDPTRMGTTPVPSSGQVTQGARSEEKDLHNVIHALREIALNVGELSR